MTQVPYHRFFLHKLPLNRFWNGASQSEKGSYPSPGCVSEMVDAVDAK